MTGSRAARGFGVRRARGAREARACPRIAAFARAELLATAGGAGARVAGAFAVLVLRLELAVAAGLARLVNELVASVARAAVVVLGAVPLCDEVPVLAVPAPFCAQHTPTHKSSGSGSGSCVSRAAHDHTYPNGDQFHFRPLIRTYGTPNGGCIVRAVELPKSRKIPTRTTSPLFFEIRACARVCEAERANLKLKRTWQDSHFSHR